MRLIDADKLEISMIAEFNDEYGDTVPVYGVTAEDIDNAPTVDAIVLPIKIGQTVWCASRYYGKVYPLVIERIDIQDDGMIMIDDNFSVWNDTDVGKRLFLTREAAEAALKARKNK